MIAAKAVSLANETEASKLTIDVGYFFAIVNCHYSLPKDFHIVDF